MNEITKKLIAAALAGSVLVAGVALAEGKQKPRKKTVAQRLASLEKKQRRANRRVRSLSRRISRVSKRKAQAVKGVEGPQGPQGAQGPPGFVTRDRIRYASQSGSGDGGKLVVNAWCAPNEVAIGGGVENIGTKSMIIKSAPTSEPYGQMRSGWRIRIARFEGDSPIEATAAVICARVG